MMPRILGAGEPIGGAVVRSIDMKAWPAPVYLRQADGDDVEEGRLARLMAVLPVELSLGWGARGIEGVGLSAQAEVARDAANGAWVEDKSHGAVTLRAAKAPDDLVVLTQLETALCKRRASDVTAEMLEGRTILSGDVNSGVQ